MAVTSMSRNSIGFGQEKSNRVSGKDSNLEWCQITTTPTGSFSDADGVWNYWIFKSNSTLTVGRSGRVDYLVVAGGATGGANNTLSNAGGGGAGGVIESPEYARIDAGSYAVTIGSGGAAVTSTPNDGNDSSIGSLAVAIGGGSAPDTRATEGNPGGCGGGAGDNNGLGVQPRGGDGTFGQGFRGGQGSANGGSGGGAGGVGTDNGGAGGVGRTTTIIPTSVATTEAVGEVDSGTLYFAGGGGGGGANAPGGLGGGGDAAAADNRSADCPPNTGGGSGTSDTTQGSPYAGAGGSGVVIVRTRV